jgi:hypothetical protein
MQEDIKSYGNGRDNNEQGFSIFFDLLIENIRELND